MTLDLRNRIVGLDQQVPLINGRQVAYINFDNSASTPPMVDVMDAIERFVPYYASVHRGTGFKSRLSTEAYDRAHAVIAAFVGADPATNTVIFGKNTTEAINKLAFRLPLEADSVVLTTQLEHHSNDLPWRARAQVVHVPVTADGHFDEAAFDKELARHGRRVALVAVSGASNVTGYLQPIHRLARKAHQAGARILVDAAQLAPHRQVRMLPDDHPEHLDFVALSAHKMYAPFGTGALVGPKAVFLEGEPEYRGGGTVDVVTLDEVEWAGMPDRDEAGSPNVIGAVAMAAAAQALMDIGMEAIADHERQLMDYALPRLAQVPGLRFYGLPSDDNQDDKVGVIPFNLDGSSHFLVAAILGYEAGIGVRSGCFCAHPYVVHLLQLTEAQSESWRRQLLGGDRSQMPGMVRASFGCYNQPQEVDRLVEALHMITNKTYHGEYQLDPASGEYTPAGFTESLEAYFALA